MATFPMLFINVLIAKQYKGQEVNMIYNYGER